MRFFTSIFIAALCFVLSIQASPLPFAEKLLGDLSKPLNDAQSKIESELGKYGGGAPLNSLGMAQKNIENNSGVHVLGGAIPQIGETTGAGKAAAGDKNAAMPQADHQATTDTSSKSTKSDDERT
ncbi:hypothetical protein LRAMOSA03882 [Lichtheimia ramosa]|uniref:Uncharacterized protein n=1 Tax=Lichtheimia ramosa TaxID=688394 RepID=A0A077WWP0_9FUNG|nr:hypothetical protein LRAMOSA03882 [Lichtheimia ramosa]